MEESINLSAWLGCDRTQAFNMFTNKEHLQSWLPVVANVDPKVGGTYELTWSLKPDIKKKTKKKIKKKKTTIGCKILAYEPDKYLAFEWKGSTDKPSSDSSQLHTQVAVYFLPMDSNKKRRGQFTEVHLILTGWKDIDEGKEVKTWIETTWTDAFEKLIEHVNDLKEENSREDI